MKFFNNLKLKYKIIALTTLVNFLVIISISITLNIVLDKDNKDTLEKTEYRLRESFDLYIRYQVETVYTMVEKLNQLAKEGAIDNELAYNLSVELLRDIRYGLMGYDETDGYFWADTVEGVNVVLYGRQDVEGFDRDDWVDSYGNYMIRDMRKKALEGGGFTDYYFPKLGQEEPLHKRSYVLYHEEFDLIIGTGSYTDDIDEILLSDKIHREEQMSKTKYITNSIYIFGIILMFIVIYISTEYFIVKPVELVTEHAKKISDLDLCGEIEEKYLSRQDEIGLLENSFKSLSDKLNEVITDIKSGAKKISFSITELDRGNEELATMTSEQAASLEETSATLEEISAIIKVHTEKTVELNKNMANTEKKATMISEISDTLKLSMAHIKESSSKITNILDIIDEITFQTNILALNAAVEAARAGENGKGFSVITSEIRNLSKKTAEASKDINVLVKNNYTKIIEGEELINSVAIDLESILHDIELTGDYVEEISSSADEQQRGVELINVAVSELNDITQTNAGIAEETADVAEELKKEYLKFLKIIDLFKQEEKFDIKK